MRMSEQTPEDREQQVLDQEQDVLDNGQLTVNPYNAAEVAHQRWLETGQTEPDSVIATPEEDEDADDSGEDDE
jgi:hypothetical protein